jgi:hypothetical protein
VMDLAQHREAVARWDGAPFAQRCQLGQGRLLGHRSIAIVDAAGDERLRSGA